eukprot:jgi/Botrbrau1/15712/Bobra.4_1s0083.1
MDSSNVPSVAAHLNREPRRDFFSKLSPSPPFENPTVEAAFQRCSVKSSRKADAIWLLICGIMDVQVWKKGGPVSLIFALLAFSLLILNRIAPQIFWKCRTPSVTAYKLGKAIGIAIIGNVVCKQEKLEDGSESFAALHSVFVGGKVFISAIAPWRRTCESLVGDLLKIGTGQQHALALG